jgi:hypothetical protein
MTVNDPDDHVIDEAYPYLVALPDETSPPLLRSLPLGELSLPFQTVLCGSVQI